MTEEVIQTLEKNEEALCELTEEIACVKSDVKSVTEHIKYLIISIITAIITTLISAIFYRIGF